MKWYSGGIAEAITYSKSKGAIFVVYIEGTDDKSQKISQLIDNGELGPKLEQECFVAVKLEGGSTAHQQFSEIYKEPSIPSLYFIGKNGVPVDIITGTDVLDNICERVDNVLVKSEIATPNTTNISSSVISDNFIKHESTADDSKVVCDNDTIKFVNKVSEGGSGEYKKENDKIEENVEKNSEMAAEEKELTAEEKLQRAKELIELKRQQKEEEEKEIERQKEIERRKMGQSVQQLKKWQEDQELKQLKEEREREKRENQLARERILAQIAQDRAERQSRQNNSMPVETTKPTSQSPPKVSSNNTRLQFKLPDGSSTTQEFENSASLESVVGYIRANLPLPFTNFTLSTVFPRREFMKNDYAQSLIDLQLSPTAVILVIPQSTGPVAQGGSGTFTALIYSMFFPLFTLFDYLKSFIFGSTSSGRNQQKRPSDEPLESKRSDSSKRKVAEGSSVVRRQGNIHRLSDTNDSDDENNTWNGNSTQQM